MAKQTISFPDDLYLDVQGRVKRTMGAKFSPFIVELVRRGLSTLDDKGISRPTSLPENGKSQVYQNGRPMSSEKSENSPDDAI